MLLLPPDLAAALQPFFLSIMRLQQRPFNQFVVTASGMLLSNLALAGSCIDLGLIKDSGACARQLKTSVLC